MATIACGQEITEDTVLELDLSCPSGPALIIAADNVTLDLGGHTVSGDPASDSDTPGILFRGVSGSTVRNGTVQRFAAGVVISGGSGNVVQNVTVQDNVGGGDYGDGIVIDNSSENRVEGNTVQRNGPYSGISLVHESERNEIRHNIVTDNNMMQVGDPGAGRQDMGIRVEGPGASHNKLDSNTVTGSGSDGISVLATCTNPDSAPPCAGSPVNQYNRVLNNICSRNGTSGRGDGIKVFTMPTPVPPAHNTVADNCANDNTTNGICFDGGTSNNKALRNSAHGNGAKDGFDGNTEPPCGSNVWEKNDFGSANLACVGGQTSLQADASGAGQTPQAQLLPNPVPQEQVEGLFRRNLEMSAVT